MNITRLEIEGFRSYGEKQVIDFQSGTLYLLTGENRDRGISSAAGKSTILKAITTALFEENDDGSTHDHAINSTQPHLGCRIAVTFTDDTGTSYYVVYARKHHEEGTHWTLFRWTGSMWDAEQGSRITDTKEIIRRVIRMTYDQFINQAYIPQHKVADFIGRTDKERKAIFGNLLGLDDCDKYQKAASDWRKELAAENLRLEGALTQVKTRRTSTNRADLTRESRELSVKIRDLKQVQENHVSRFSELEAEAEKLSVIAELTTAKGLHEKRLEELTQSLCGLTLVVDPHETLSHLNDLETQKDDLHQRLGEAERNVRHADDRLRSLQRLTDVCDACETILSPEHKPGLFEKYTHIRENGVVAVKELRNALEQTKKAWNECRDLYQSTLQAQLKRNQVILSINSESELLHTAEEQIRDLRETIGEGVDIPQTIANERRQLLSDKATNDAALFDAEKRFSIVTERLTQDDLDEKTETELIRQQKEVATSFTSVKRCEEIVGEKGFKSFKIHSSRDTFNSSLGEHLSVLTDGEMQATLVTEVPKADGRGMKAELDILVRDGDKSGVSIRQYSGGEKAFLSLGITGAFGDLANQQSDGGVNLLLLDEPFANMDSWQEEQACKLLANFARDGRIVIVVTNHQGVKDRGKFDIELRAVKENHITHVEEFDLSGDH